VAYDKIIEQDGSGGILGVSRSNLGLGIFILSGIVGFLNPFRQNPD
jgi:hypothetical protein